MIIFGGFEECSFSDYPDRLSAVIFTVGCNLKCKYCHNPQLVIPKWKINTFNEEQLFLKLDKLKKKIDAIVISGGEPLFYDSSYLIKLCMNIKSIGFKYIKLDTNGHFPEGLKNIVESGFIDYVAMDVKDDEEGYREKNLCGAGSNIEKAKRSIDVLNSSKVKHEYRTTCIGKYHTSEKIKNIVEMIGENQKLYLQPCLTRHKILFEEDSNIIEPLNNEMQTLLEEALKFNANTEIR